MADKDNKKSKGKDDKSKDTAKSDDKSKDTAKSKGQDQSETKSNSNKKSDDKEKSNAELKGSEEKNGKDKASTKSKKKAEKSKKSSKWMQEHPKETKCMIGSTVPDFEASVYLADDEHFDGKLNPQELAGVHTVLFFFSGNFFGPINEDLTVFMEAAKSGEFSHHGVDLNFLAVSTDSVKAHKLYCQVSKENGGLKGLKVALLSDSTGEISKMFNVYDQSTHKAFPSYVILSPDLQVVAKFTSDHNVAIDPMAMIGVLEQLLLSKAAGEGTKTEPGKEKRSKEASKPKKDSKTDSEKNPENEKNRASEGDSKDQDLIEEDDEVQRRIKRREKIKEEDKLKAESSKKEASA